MNRRNLLARAAAIPLLPLVWPALATIASPASAAIATVRRVRPSDPGWPSAAAWEKLNQAVGGHLIKVEPLFASCGNGAGASCDDMLAALKNP
jgi:hypothetical protein